jgi:hypothetical protein
MQFMDDEHYDTLLDEDVAVYRPDGSPLLILLKRAIDPQKASNAWSVLKKFNGKTDNRGVASGIRPIQRKKVDGTLSSTSRVPKGWGVFSAVAGAYERTVRMPYAHPCSWNAQNPAAFERMFPLLQQTSGLFAKYVPERYANQMEQVKRTHEDWVVPGTAYTTITVNKNFRTAAHKDAGDLESGFSNMIVITQGSFAGANLVLPNWRIAVKLSNLDFIMFDAHEFHGNTALVKLSKDAVRCSLVCYYRENMYKCGSQKYELEQAKNRKPGQPVYWENK